MPDSESLEALQAQLNHLREHVTEQDAEIYRLSKRVDALLNAIQVQKLQIESLSGQGASGAGDMPADEKPPHY
jgi:uncharacterized coiled-coil protein SlyX